MRIARLAALPLALALAACGPEPPAARSPADIAAARRAYVPGVSPIFCYHTLAEPDCYAVPQPGPPNRLIGSYDGPAPEAP